MLARVSSVAAIAVAAASLTVACNALTGVGDLAVGDDDVTTADGGSGREDGATTGNRDATGGVDGDDDGAIVVLGEDGGDDAATDAAADADAAAPLGYCASLAAGTADVCIDFDDGVFPGAWSIHATQPATATTITTTGFFKSTPRGVQFATPGGTAAAAYIYKTAANAATTEVVLHYAIRYDTIRPSADTETSTILLGASGGNRYESQLELLPSGELNWEEESPLADGSVPEINVPLGIVIPPGQWRDVKITIAIASSSSTITWAVTGSAPVTKSANAHLYKGVPEFVVGDNNTTTLAQSITYDDVYYRVK